MTIFVGWFSQQGSGSGPVQVHQQAQTRQQSNKQEPNKVDSFNIDSLSYDRHYVKRHHAMLWQGCIQHAYAPHALEDRPCAR
jgi:hypothetical protein